MARQEHRDEGSPQSEKQRPAPALELDEAALFTALRPLSKLTNCALDLRARLDNTLHGPGSPRLTSGHATRYLL
jgi:hypothetical protein